MGILIFWLIYISLAIGLMLGWVLNIIALIHMMALENPINAEFIIRAIGVPVAILGAVMGYI